MKVKVITDYFDRELQNLIKAEEVLEVKNERAKKLITAKVAVEYMTNRDKSEKGTRNIAVTQTINGGK